jgi:hypothetical protein
VSEDRQYYLQQDFGEVSLLSHLEAKGFCDEVYSLLKIASRSWHACKSKATKG